MSEIADREAAARQAMVRWGRSLFERGLTAGSSGNLSVRLDDGYLFTPTNSCLGFLEPERLSKLDAGGAHLAGCPPTKELPLHFGFYAARPGAKAVVHLHSTHATALSCLSDTDPQDAVPAITPYVVMRVGRVAVVPYARPGDATMRSLVERLAASHSALLLENHGPAVCGPSLEAAVFAMEELEEAAKLAILLRGLPVRHLDRVAVEDLETSFRLR